MDFFVGVPSHLFWIYHTHNVSLIIYNLDYKVGLELIILYQHQFLILIIYYSFVLLSLGSWVEDTWEYFVLFFFFFYFVLFLQLTMNQIFQLKLRKWNWNLKAHVKIFEWILLNLYMFYTKTFTVVLLTAISTIVFWISPLFYCRKLAKHFT